MDDPRLRILVVEDHKLAQKVAVMIINSLGYDVDTADTAEQAIVQFKQHQYDFIFMDLGLPDTDGYTVTKIIRELEEKTNIHTPIVALTAQMDDEFRQNSIKSGMDDFLSKPLTVDKAKAMIDKYIQRQNNSLE